MHRINGVERSNIRFRRTPASAVGVGRGKIGAQLARAPRIVYRSAGRSCWCRTDFRENTAKAFSPPLLRAARSSLQGRGRRSSIRRARNVRVAAFTRHAANRRTRYRASSNGSGVAAIVKYDPDPKNINFRLAPRRRGTACRNGEKNTPVYP